MELGYMGTSLETDILNGFKYVNRVSKLLENNLPAIVTKEELMNYYLHEMRAKGAVDTSITGVNLIQAANLANIRVMGKSKLEVNVPVTEQWKYISEGITSYRKQAVRERLENNKEDIITAYEKGVTTQEIADAWHCSIGTMNTYLKKWGAKIRKRGRVKIGEGILRETGSKRKKRRKKSE